MRIGGTWAILIGKVKELVYSKTEKDIMDAYSKLLKKMIYSRKSVIGTRWDRRVFG